MSSRHPVSTHGTAVVDDKNLGNCGESLQGFRNQQGTMLVEHLLAGAATCGGLECSLSVPNKAISISEVVEMWTLHGLVLSIFS